MIACASLSRVDGEWDWLGSVSGCMGAVGLLLFGILGREAGGLGGFGGIFGELGGGEGILWRRGPVMLLIDGECDLWHLSSALLRSIIRGEEISAVHPVVGIIAAVPLLVRELTELHVISTTYRYLLLLREPGAGGGVRKCPSWPPGGSRETQHHQRHSNFQTRTNCNELIPWYIFRHNTKSKQAPKV